MSAWQLDMARPDDTVGMSPLHYETWAEAKRALVVSLAHMIDEDWVPPMLHRAIDATEGDLELMSLGWRARITEVALPPDDGDLGMGGARLS